MVFCLKKRQFERPKSRKSKCPHCQNNPFGHWAILTGPTPARLQLHHTRMELEFRNDPPPPRSCHSASRHHGGGGGGGATNHLRCFRRYHSAAAAAATKPSPMFPPPPPPPCTAPARRFHPVTTAQPPTPQWHHHTLSKLSLDQELCYSCTDPKCRHQRHQPHLQPG